MILEQVEQIVNLANSGNVALVVVLVILVYAIRYLNDLSKILRNEVKDGILKSHEQHSAIIDKVTYLHQEMENKGLLLEQKIDITLDIIKNERSTKK